MSFLRLTTISCLIFGLVIMTGCNDPSVVENTTDISNTPTKDVDIAAKNVKASTDAKTETKVEAKTETKKAKKKTKIEPKIPTAPSAGYLFEDPVRIKAGDEYIAVHSPGYACPTMADVDGDGLEDLVVGQFNKGLMWFCKNIADSPGEPPKFAESDWIRSDGKRAQVPGVW